MKQIRMRIRVTTLLLVWILVCAAFVGILIVSENVEASTWIVDQSGGGDRCGV